MKKMKTVFVLDYDNDALATRVIQPDASWVFNEDGVVATVKIDGTAAFFNGGILYKRWDRKLKKKFLKKAKNSKGDFIPEDWMFKDIPEGAIACEEMPDPVTFHQQSKTYSNLFKCVFNLPACLYEHVRFHRLSRLVYCRISKSVDKIVTVL